MSIEKPKEKPLKPMKKEEQQLESDDSDLISSFFGTKDKTHINGSRKVHGKAPKVKTEEKNGEDTKPSSTKAIGKETQMNGTREVPVNAATVKKEVTDGKETKPTIKKIVKNEKVAKVKKEETDGEETKPIIKKIAKIEKVTGGISPSEDGSAKKKKKKKKQELEGKKAGPTGENDSKRKKVYTLPGQKHESPEERDPLRIFYETLNKQVPGSEMAAFWMMERGLLPAAEAKRVYEKKLKKNQQQKFASPVKAATVKRTSQPSAKKSPTSKPVSAPSKKRKMEGSDSDSDLICPRKKIKKNKAS